MTWQIVDMKRVARVLLREDLEGRHDAGSGLSVKDRQGRGLKCCFGGCGRVIEHEVVVRDAG